MAKKILPPFDPAADKHTIDMSEAEAREKKRAAEDYDEALSGYAEEAKEVADATAGFEEAMDGYAEEAKEIAEAAWVARANAVQAKEQNAIAISRSTDGLVERAELLASEITFPDVLKKRVGDMFVAVPENTDTNKRAVLDALFKDAESRPHFDEHRGRIVDHKGVIIDDFYSGTEMLGAFNAIGMRKLRFSEVIDAMRAYALDHRQNDLTVRLNGMIPSSWDGTPRIEGALIRMFESHDTEFTRALGVYFWLSLYCRCMHPGEMAPIVLTIIGAQNSGKSYFGTLLARMLTGDPQADSVQLNLDGSYVDFLREITGTSPICSIGEMSGFSRADLNRVKNQITRTIDRFSYKFEGTINVPRQWVTIMDSNRYEGLLRDETGNRRFAPFFVGQLESIDGEAQWKPDFKADFTELRENLWQMFAECRAWLESNGGLEGYRAMVNRVSKMVTEFSAKEVRGGHGVVKDDHVAPYIVAALKNAPCFEIRKRDASGGSYVFYDRSALVTAIQSAALPLDPTRAPRFLTDLNKACLAKGGVQARRECKTIPGYAFNEYATKDQLMAAIGASTVGDEEKAIPGMPFSQRF